MFVITHGETRVEEIFGPGLVTFGLPWFTGPMSEATTATTVRRNRDRRGRFQRPPVHIDRARQTGCLFYDANGDTHSRNHCGDIVGRVRRCHSTPRGWLCGTCIAVTEVDPDQCMISKVGSARCEGCDQMLPAKRFPTTLLAGVGQVRDWRVCRACRRNGVHVHGELGWGCDERPVLGPDGVSWFGPDGGRVPSPYDRRPIRAIVTVDQGTVDQGIQGTLVRSGQP